jgi:hypothetical protein
MVPRVRPRTDQLLASPVTKGAPLRPRTTLRPPALKTGKRARPKWRTPNDDDQGKRHVATEPRKQYASEHGPMFTAQGKKKLMSPAACVSFHPFAETLSEWEMGVPVDCGAPWEWETIKAAVEKGVHQSATMDESIALIAEDVDYQVKAGYAEIMSWAKLCQLRPKNLKVFPLAVVPQRDRRGCMILDLSFAV